MQLQQQPGCVWFYSPHFSSEYAPQLQRYCEDLRTASQEIQGFLDVAESENSQLQQEISEMQEVMEAHHLQKALKAISEKRGSLQLTVFAEGDSLAHELQQEEPQSDYVKEADAPVQNTRSVSIAEEQTSQQRQSSR
ncbi:unnamed protein product [Symbiodinium pilosum]|uniref:Uncharacterized protein n=1 Tax=Symbiodinium pilosum TaxID=2952 RepID=A0A812X1P3_SYMPI|nr:unnamed protein product [Symbiodinium pilosum]